MTATWQPGTTYIPGSIVQPTNSAPAGLTPLTNAGFETGDLTGWTNFGVGTWSVGGSPYQGSFKATVIGDGDSSLNNVAQAPVTPGQTISASGFARLTNSGDDHQQASLTLNWLDASHNPISQTYGAKLTGVGGSYKPISVSGVAPAGAAYVQLALGAHVTSGGNIDFDAFTWTNGFSGPPAGLLYKATQAAPGKSGATEPAWPGNTTTPVTDNQVTWQGVIATQLVWTAVPINKSGTTEPTWPTQPGAAVHDGSIDWVATVPVVTDTNWPSSKITTIAASKIYKADKDIVKYSATVNPLDWSTKDDAGYLPFGLQTYGDNPAVAMGLYRSNLVVFSSSGFQMWQVDENPANSALMDALPIATSYHKALSPVANDLLFLSSEGVRSMGVAASGVNLQAGDVGMPIDPLVLDALAQSISDPTVNILSTFIPARAQYWLAFSNFPTANLTITGDMPDGAIGAFISGAYTITGGQPPYTVTLNSGTLPPGITLNADGSYIGYYTAQGAYSWQIKVVDSVGTIALKNDSATVAGMIVSGSVPNGAIGDAVDTFYTASAGHAPYTYAISAGALPPGLTLGTDGHVTGTFTTVGAYSWTVQATDSYGNTATVPGSNTVSLPMLAGRWLATNTGDYTEVWTSSDPLSWPNAPLPLTASAALDAFGGGYDGSALALGAGSGGTANSNALIVDNQPMGASLTASVVNTGKPGLTLATINGIMFRCLDNNLPSYSYSTDHGVTWNTVNLAGSLYMHAIARLNSGRWIAMLANGATQTLQYSDQAIPTTWTDSGVSIAGTYVDILACDGVTALVPNNTGGMYHSTDGATWTYTAGMAPVSYAGTQKIGRAIGAGVFLFQGASADGTFYVSADSGAHWTMHTRASGEAAGQLNAIASHGNTVTLCWGPGTTSNCDIDVSHDLGSTWAMSALPWASPRTKYPICTYLG